MSVQDADLITVGTYPTSTSVPNLQSVVRLMGNVTMMNTDNTIIASRLDINTMLVKS